MTNKPMLSVEREPVAWAVEISGCLKFFEQKKSAENARRRYEKVMDAERMEPFPLFAEQPEPAADHTQCEECKGWGYHENHYDGGGTECGECSGSGKATVEQFSGDTVVCRRYQLEQHPGQNFYHYDLEPVYGSVPVTVSELITMVESAPVAVVMPDVDDLAQIIRKVDDSHTLGAGSLAEAILEEVARLNGVKT